MSLSILYAQEETDVPLPKSLQNTKSIKNPDRKIKFLTGGTFGFQIGNYTAIELSPKFGFYPCEYLSLGITGTYMFMRDRYYNYNSHTFGGGVFVEGYLWQRLILHAEYEYLNFEVTDYNSLGQLVQTRVGNHGVLLGPGYRQIISDRISLYFLVLFCVYQGNYSPYAIPNYKVGITIDL